MTTPAEFHIAEQTALADLRAYIEPKLLRHATLCGFSASDWGPVTREYGDAIPDDAVCIGSRADGNLPSGKYLSRNDWDAMPKEMRVALQQHKERSSDFWGWEGAAEWLAASRVGWPHTARLAVTIDGVTHEAVGHGGLQERARRRAFVALKSAMWKITPGAQRRSVIVDPTGCKVATAWAEAKYWTAADWEHPWLVELPWWQEELALERAEAA